MADQTRVMNTLVLHFTDAFDSLTEISLVPPWARKGKD